MQSSNQVNTRLSSLKALVRDVLADSEVVTINPGVVKALSALNDTLQQFPEASCSSTSRPTISQVHDGDHPEGSITGGPPMPSVPAIPDEKLRQAVFTHSAYSGAHDTNYDRLEVLGDAYIELIATRLVWEKFPGIPAGRMSQIRETMVKNETLARFSELYGFDHMARVPADHWNQPKRWMKTKGDIFEAYVAAVILSHPEGDGYRLVEKWLTTLWMPNLDNLGHQKASLRSKEILAQQIMGKHVKLEYLEERPSVHKKGTGTQIYFIG